MSQSRPDGFYLKEIVHAVIHGQNDMGSMAQIPILWNWVAPLREIIAVALSTKVPLPAAA
jgi:hypothetical protein